MMKRPVGKMTLITNDPNVLFANATDSTSDMFIPTGTCTCCDKMRWVPLYLNTSVNGMKVNYQHNELFDGGTISKNACADCDYKLLELKMFCIVNQNLVE